MANYTLQQVQQFIGGKTWNELVPEMRESVSEYLNAQALPGYYLIVPDFRTDELAALVASQNNVLEAIMLQSGDLVLPIDVVVDDTTFGYAHDFLSGLIIRLVDSSEFPVSDI